MNASDEQLSIPIGDLWKHVADALNNGLLGQHGKLDDGVTPRYQFEFVDSQEVNGMAIGLAASDSLESQFHCGQSCGKFALT